MTMNKQINNGRISPNFLVLILMVILFIFAGGLSCYYQQKSKVITVAFYTGSSWDVPNGKPYQVIDEAIKEFHKQYPNVKVKYETGITKKDYLNWLSGKIVSGKTPDVILIPDGNFSMMAEEGLLTDLRRFIKSDALNTDLFYQPLLTSTQYRGGQYALPYEANPNFMIYNQTLLKKYQLPNDFNHLTPENFESISSSLAKVKKEKYYGTTDAFNWEAAAKTYDSLLLSANNRHVNLISTRFARTVKLMQQLRSASANLKVNTDLFDQGKVAFEPITLAQYRTYASYPYYVTQSRSFAIRYSQMPSLAGHSATSIATSSWGISSSSQNKMLSWKLIKILCSNQRIQQKLMTTSAGSSVLKPVVNSKKTKEILWNYGAQARFTSTELDRLLRTGKVNPSFKEYQLIINLLESRLDQALDDNDIDEKLYDIQSDANDLVR